MSDEATPRWSKLPGLGAKTQHHDDLYTMLSKEAFVEMALKVWRISRDIIDDDDAVIQRLRNSTNEVRSAAKQARRLEDTPMPTHPGADASAAQLQAYRKLLGDARKELTNDLESNEKLIQALYFHAMVTYADGQISALGLARWAHNGFPQVVMGHKFCASLLCTGMGEDALEQVKPPWSSFIIEVPDGILPLDSQKFGSLSVRRILVCQMHSDRLGGPAWAYVAFTETVMSLWRFGVSTAELLPPVLEHATYLDADPTSEQLTSQDERVTTLIGRLIINTCLAMSDKDSVKKIGPGHKAHAGNWNKRTEREPIVRTFQVGKPVTLDLRDHVRSYVLHGARAAPTVQTLVRGHFKTQRHGPKNSLVKVIWRLPFWRGPEDAPILVRPHELGKEKSDG